MSHFQVSQDLDEVWTVKVLVRRSLYSRSLTGVLQFGAGKRDSVASPICLTPGEPWGWRFKIDIFTFGKIFEKDGETPSVTTSLRTG